MKELEKSFQNSMNFAQNSGTVNSQSTVNFGFLVLSPPLTLITYSFSMNKVTTRPDTRPIPVADGWAGTEMRILTLSNSITMTDGQMDQRTDEWTKPYRVACPQLKTQLVAFERTEKILS